MKFEITNFSLAADWTLDVKPGGRPPLIAKATIEFPEGPDWTRTVTIKLSPHRLERLLDTFQQLIDEEFSGGLIHNDDVMVGGADVIAPEPASAEDLLRELINAEGPPLGNAAWADRVEAFLAKHSEG